MFKIFEQLLEPFFAFVIRSLKSGHAHPVGLEASGGFHGAIDLFSELGIFCDYVGCLDSRHVEGLGGRRANDEIIPKFVRDQRKRRVIVPPINQVRMDLVGNYGHVVFCAKMGDFKEFLPRPDSAHGIVRRAKDEKLHVISGELLVKVLKVELIVSPAIGLELGNLGDSAVCLDHPPEGIVDRLADEHLVAGLGQGFDHRRDGEDHAGHGDDFVLFNVPVEASVIPVCDGCVVLVVGRHVAEDLAVGGLLHGFGDRGRALEVHVGDPHGNQVLDSFKGHVFDISWGSSVVDLVEKFFVHVWLLLFGCGGCATFI